MTELNKFIPPNESKNPVAQAGRKQRAVYPTGWEPRVTQTQTSAEAVSGTFIEEPDEKALLEGWMLDPEVWAIIPDTLVVNRWQMAGEWQHQYKAKLTRRTAPNFDFEELFKGVGKWKPPAVAKPKTDNELIIALSDWQIGQEDGDGTVGTVQRVVDSCSRILAYAKQTRPSGIVVVGLGDLVENCDGHYPGQTFTVELDRRQQVRVVRRLIRDFLIKLSRLGIPVRASAVAGNHGENRKNGKAFTTPGDNDDVAVMEQVAEILAANPEAFGHISFHIPDDRLEVLLDIQGWRVGFHHGHVAGAGATPQQKQANWWKNHAFQMSLIGDADFLVTGHYHHLSVVDHGPRVHFQAPAMDGGSRWWENLGGGKSAAGTLTFTVGENGWDNLRVM